MSWWLRIQDEKGEIPEVKVSSFYIGGTYAVEPHTRLPIVGPCEVKFVRWFRETSEKLVARGGKFTCEVT